MRVLVRVAILLVVLAGAGLAALLVLLPALVDDAAVRARIERSVRDLSGRDVSYAALSAGLVPPRLSMERVSLAGAGAGEPPLLEAEGLHLELSFWSLLARRVVIDSLTLEGATLHLVRTRSGLRLPGRGERSGREPRRPEAGARPAGSGARADPARALPAIRELVLRDCTLELEDRTARRGPVRWSLTRAHGRAGPAAADRPVRFSVAGALGDGGSLRLEGSYSPSGEIDLDASLDGVALRPVQAYLESDRALRGALSGTLRASGPAGAPSLVEADLAIADAVLDLEELALRGRVTLRASLSGQPLAGRFDIDATDAELEYQYGVFAKPAGTAATATGRVVPGPDGSLAVDDLYVKIRNPEVTPGGRVWQEAP